MTSDQLPLTHPGAKLRQPRIPVPLLFHLVVAWRTYRSTIVTCVAALLLPILLPLIHLGLVFRLWDRYLHTVDRDSCSCSCWDTGFKGIYETGISSYKHVYFNLTPNTFKIWAITVVWVVVLYEHAAAPGLHHLPPLLLLVVLLQLLERRLLPAVEPPALLLCH
ncbi:hypothetical protein LAZ67_21000229 [Cordylochernes scorpioides]|uniref:Uncharacterized protein n=1 Tax=Cordylochernes scorpioides TaxID=51811 RepID=A0ABY6LL85_9ARAC|nr:hypothetical protein LAZ67_21000229 [Cordylochernes scorpioides]